MLLLVAFREQIFVEVVISCAEVTVREAGDPPDSHTPTSRNRASKAKFGVIVEVIFVTALFLFIFFLQVCRRDFDGFKKLFHRFLQVKGPSVDWAKISRPPEDAVSSPGGIESSKRDL